MVCDMNDECFTNLELLIRVSQRVTVGTALGLQRVTPIIFDICYVLMNDKI